MITKAFISPILIGTLTITDMEILIPGGTLILAVCTRMITLTIILTLAGMLSLADKLTLADILMCHLRC
jgi:hypothetical protein